MYHRIVRNVSQNQSRVPLISKLKAHVDLNSTSFHVPGHSSGRLVPKDILDLIGTGVFNSDLTEIAGLDNLHHPVEAIRQAQLLAAEAYETKETHFLVGGSSAGIKTMMLASLNPGEKLVISRDCHKSAINALILGSIEPVFVYPSNDDFHYPASSTDYVDILEKKTSVQTVLITAPNYYGMLNDVKTISDKAKRNKSIVIVDEAHGSHLCWSSELPESSLCMNVDMVVHSAHKTLPALTQGSYLHVVGQGSNSNRLGSFLSIMQTSSPSYPIMASLDACRKYMYFNGEKCLKQTLDISRWLRDEINSIDGLKSCYRKEAIENGAFDSDETKLFIDLSKSGLDGYKADEFLRTKNIFVEMTEFRGVLCMITVATNWDDAHRLVEALKDMIHDVENNHSMCPRDLKPPRTKLDVLPRDAFFSETALIPITEAIGRVSASVVTSCPPGTPALIPGEVITEAIVSFMINKLEMDQPMEGVSESWISVVK